MAEIYKCKNCEKPVDDSSNFCPNCGQKTAEELTLGVLFSNTISNYFSVDARFFRSFLLLMTKPGVIARRFVDGKRKTYLHPAKFYLFASIVFFFIFAFTLKEADNEVSKSFEKVFEVETEADSIVTDINNTGPLNIKIDMSDKEGGSGNSLEERRNKLDSLIAINASQEEKLLAMGMDEDSGGLTRTIYIQLLKLYEKRGDGIVKTLQDTIPIAMFILLPTFALFLKLLFWKRGIYAHHLVFSLYFFTFLFASFCILILANTFIDIPIMINVLILIPIVFYLVFAIRHFYKSHFLVSVFKASLISILYMAIVLPIAMIGVVIVSFLMY